MLWRYTAIDAAAREVTGVAKGTRAKVAARLKAEGCLLTALEPDLVQSFNHAVSGSALPSHNLSLFFRDFSNMLSAGIALSHILGTFRESNLDARLATACAMISDELVTGRSLAQAMESSGVVPRLAVNALRAGERAGNMPLVMGLLADYFQLAADLKGKCLRALAYPLCVLFFLLAALVYVSQAVVPQLTPLLPAQAMDNALTQFMLGLSRMLREGWVLILGALGAGVMALTVYIRRDPGGWDALLGRIPVVGNIRKDLQISLCFFDLFILLKSGIPLDTALGEAAASAGHLAGMHLGHCRQHLACGQTFSGALAATGYFPRLIVETVRLGEAMGRYDEHCERVFKLYYRSFETRLGVCVAALQPALLGICALFVMAMALAFLQPIYANLTHIGVITP